MVCRIASDGGHLPADEPRTELLFVQEENYGLVKTIIPIYLEESAAIDIAALLFYAA